jgi:Proto-chlorophyllide reductase 57 kD subunit
MKFLCVPCDSPMTLQTVSPPEGGSLSVVYACPECGYEMAMLTNAYETQVVQSLGVRIGPAEAQASAGAKAGGCPFSGMIQAAGADRPGADEVPVLTSAPAEAEAPPGHVSWTAAAEARLARVPGFVRPMARTGIEQFARDRGLLEVDEAILDEAREFFGM